MSQDAKFTAEPRRRLSDDLAERIQASVATGELRPGDRLPPILEMARNFRVAPTTVREALIRLETKRVVEIRHGAGVFINRRCLNNPDGNGVRLAAEMHDGEEYRLLEFAEAVMRHAYRRASEVTQRRTT